MASQTSPLTDRDRLLWAMGPVDDSFPVRFPNGAVLQAFEGHCDACRVALKGGALRGRVDATFLRVVTIEAMGLCRACNLFTRFLYRVHDDLSFTGLRDGSWMRWLPRRRLGDRAWLWVRKLFVT